jgi:hypothetical protein
MLDELNIKVIAVCQVINRHIPHSDAPDHAFNAKASILRQYLSVVLANEPGVFLWDHRKFDYGRIDLLSLDGVHCNPQGQYILYRSYRGAILKLLICCTIDIKFLLQLPFRLFKFMAFLY